MKQFLKHPSCLACFDLEFDLEGFVFNVYFKFTFESEEIFSEVALNALEEVQDNKFTHRRLRDWSDLLITNEKVLNQTLISNIEILNILKN